MGRTGIAPRPHRAGPRAVRALAVALAAVALLLCGAVDVLPRSAAGPLAAGPSAAAAPATRSGVVEAPASSLAVRAAGLAAVPVPTSPGGGLPPAPGPVVAPHLVADPPTRPPTPALLASPAGTAGSRAPPGPAGT